MKRPLLILRAVAVVGLVILSLDFVVTSLLPARVLDAWLPPEDINARAYDTTVPWHHDLRPNLDMQRTWENHRYRLVTDANGFRTGPCGDAPAVQGRTAFVVGDSFVEGMGLPFEQTLGGLIACAWRAQGMAVRSLGVASFSPVIYWRKIASSVKLLGVKPSEIVLFLDVSDIFDEMVRYAEKDGRVVIVDAPPLQATSTWMRRHFMTYLGLWKLRQHALVLLGKPDDVLGVRPSIWTTDAKLQQAWATRGLERAAANLDKVVAQCREWGCRLTLVVYPWPDQVANRDLDSLQVRYWREWSAKNGTRFVNGFPPFFQLPPDETIRRYYFAGDTHFNADGTRLLFDEVWKTLGR
jgi:hypothetical protein